MEGGQHLPPQQKQNKPTGREQPRGWRPTERGGSFLKTSSAHPRLPLLIGGFESCRPPCAAGPRVDCARLSAGASRGGGRGEFPSPPVALKILPDCSPDARGPGWSRSRSRQEMPPGRGELRSLFSVCFCPGRCGGPITPSGGVTIAGLGS